MAEKSVSDLLTIGSSGVRAYQKALSTVSTNISNSENPNYVRRDLRLGELSITQKVDPYHNTQIRFGGVDTVGIARAHDPFLESNTRFTGAALYGAETGSRWMGAVESALGDNEHGVGSQLTSVFTSAEELAAVPFDTVLRSQFITNIDDAVTTINRTATDLSTLSQQLDTTAQHEATALNEALEHLGSINKSLRGSADGSSKQATLLDQRDTALAAISERLDVSITFAEQGVANIEYGGTLLVEVGAVENIAIESAPDGTLQLLSGGTTLPSPSQGSIAALVTSAETTKERRSELDDIAQQFADEVNNWQSNGQTDSGSAGQPMLDASGGAIALSMASTEVSDLALADASGASNGNILSFAALRGSGGIENGWNNIVNTQAVKTAAADGEMAAASAQHQAAREARDSLSSVDLDREAADLIRFQQAYDASARIIQVARETMQSIFSIF